MLSVCLVAYNEEKLIKRCIESIKDIADEIIVVLDGKSQDKTKKICQEYTNKIFIKEHIGFSDPHLPFAFKKAQGDWIMKIDADEFLLPESTEHIRLLTIDQNVDGYFFLWRLWNGKRYITRNKPYKPVLFRKSKLFFIGVPHGIMQSYGKTKKVNIPLEHRPNYNNWCWDTFKFKQIKRIKLHAKLLFKKFDDIPKFNFRRKDYPRSIKIRKSLCFFFPLFGVYKFLREVILGEKNIEAIKVSFWVGLYDFFLGFFVFLITIKNAIKKLINDS